MEIKKHQIGNSRNKLTIYKQSLIKLTEKQKQIAVGI